VYDKRIKREHCLVEVLKRQRLVLMIYITGRRRIDVPRLAIDLSRNALCGFLSQIKTRCLRKELLALHTKFRENLIGRRHYD